MLREVIKILMSKKTIFDDMSWQFLKMLDMSREMFVDVTDLLYLGGDKDKVSAKIFPADKELNKIECKIRSEIITHISVSGADSLASILIFMSIVKDAERIGDYVKNIYDLTIRVKDFNSTPTSKETLEIRQNIVGKFDEVKKIFEAEHKENAKTKIKEIYKLQKQCDAIIHRLFENDSEKNSTANAMISRYYKRILAHLANILTAIVMPVDKLDFFDEDNKEKINTL
jgi:phosphate transport system protein